MDIEIQQQIKQNIVQSDDSYDEEIDEIEYNNDNVTQIIPKKTQETQEIEKITPEFQQLVIDWVTLDDDIKKKRKEIKVQTDLKKK
jgi:K+/H+ antiporter YhaU regulatory subunit KhtT